jgi:hypothetical protein
MKNQNNSRVLHIIRPNCPGSSIGVKPKVLVTRSINVIRTNWLGNYFQHLNAQIFSDSTCPPRGSRHANIWSVPQTDGPQISTRSNGLVDASYASHSA